MSNELLLGEATMDRRLVHANSVAMGASGTMRFAYFTAAKTETVTQVRMITGGTAAAATPTLCRAGIYSVNDAGDLTVVGTIVNDTTLFANTGTTYTRSLSSSFVKIAGQRYAFGILVVSGAAMPTFNGQTQLPSTEAIIAPRLGAALGSLSDLPSSPVAVGGLSGSGSLFYAVVLP